MGDISRVTSATAHSSPPAAKSVARPVAAARQVASASARRWAAAAERGLLEPDLPQLLAAGPVDLTTRERKHVTALLTADVADLLAASLRPDGSTGEDGLVAVNEILALGDGEFADAVLVSLGGEPVTKADGALPDARDAFAAMVSGWSKRAAQTVAQLIGDIPASPAEDPGYIAAVTGAIRERVRISRDRGLNVLLKDSAGTDVSFSWAWGRLSGPRGYEPSRQDQAAVHMALGEKLRRDRGITALLTAEIPHSTEDLVGGPDVTARERAQQLLRLPEDLRLVVVAAWAKCVIGDLALAFMPGHDNPAETRAPLLENVGNIVKGVALAGYLPHLYEVIAGYVPAGQLADDALGLLLAVLADDGTVTPLTRRRSS